MGMTRHSDWAKALAANSTDTSFAALAPTTTMPSTGVVNMLSAGAQYSGVPNNLLLAFYGTGAENTTYSARVTGWSKIDTLWVPAPLAELACTLGTAVGVAGASVVATERFADTITQASGAASIVISSLADNRVGWVLIDPLGHELVQVSFDMTGATNGNAIYKWL